jgi:murein DD-endopeptidase MepM/ murein hydrolase activator NlpD
VRSRIILLVAFVFVAALSVAATYGLSAAAEPAAQVLRRDADIELPREYEEITAVVPEQTTLAAVMEEHELADGESAPLIEALGERFDLRRVRAGQPYRLVQGLDGRVREFSYEVDGDRVLEARREQPTGDPSFDVVIVKIPKVVELAVVEGEIDQDQSSLVAALEAAGERIDLSLAMADIFSGEMDFNADLQPGDTFRLLVEKQTRESGAFAGYGPVLAAEFVNAGRRVRAVRFAPPDGAPDYFDEAGRSLKRFFLKSPLKFEPRVTSSFSSARRHPILNYTRAHNGVDYAAGMGAPVGAVAGGIVTMAGWTGGGGRTVRVRHASGYESEYLHLSSIAVRSGARVAQGDLVGRVGSTGLATGPHLHYGLRLNGRYVNPVAEHRKMPPGDPVPAVHLTVFGTERDKLFGRLFAKTTSRANN